MNNSKENFDVFISHAGEDTEWCMRLAKDLHQAGFKVWLDVWQIKPGNDIIAAMEEGIKQSRRAAMVLTPKYFEKVWARTELRAIIYQHLTDRPGLGIPLLLQDCTRPPLLGNLAYIDFRNSAAYQSRLQHLISTLKDEKLSEAIRIADDQKLYTALLRLDYHQQVSLFQKIVEAHRVGAFLVHGAPKYGQRWLLNRLIQLIPNSITAKVIKIGLNRKACKSDVNDLWHELSGRVGSRQRLSPEKIAEEMKNLCQTQTVILIFSHVHWMPEKYMKEFIRKFWRPLTNITRIHASPQSDYRFFMFLLDYSGQVNKWKAVFAKAGGPKGKPDTPIKLPRATRFTAGILGPWMDNSLNELPRELTAQAKQTVQTILKNSKNGVPEHVIEYVCRLCGCNWYEREDIWLKY